MLIIKQIAEMAHVSIGTVDRVLHNRGRVSEETKKKIEGIIEAHGYKPNLFARNLKRSTEVTFGVMLPNKDQDDGYWQLQYEGVQQSLSEIEPFGVKGLICHYDRFSEASFEAAMTAILDANVAGLLCPPLIPSLTAKLFDKLPAHVPVVMTDSNIEHRRKTTYIGQDSYQCGILSGRLMSLVAKGTGSIPLITDAIGYYHLNERVRGFLDFFKSAPASFEFKIYEVERTDVRLFNALMDRVVAENDAIRGVFIADASAHYVAEYFEKTMGPDEIALVGHDLIPDNIAYLEKGYIDFVIHQRPMSQAYEGIQMLYRHVLLHEEEQEDVLMPLDIVTKENLASYLNNRR